MLLNIKIMVIPHKNKKKKGNRSSLSQLFILTYFAKFLNAEPKMR